MYARQFRAILFWARNRLATTLDYTVMQMIKSNRVKGYLFTKIDQLQKIPPAPENNKIAGLIRNSVHSRGEEK